MKKVKVLNLLLGAVVALSPIVYTSCSDDDTPPPPPGPVDVVIPDDAVDLSAEETANCYIVAPGRTAAFKAVYKGNSLTETIGDVADAVLLWQDAPGLLADVGYSSTEQKIVVVAGDKSGNAVVAAKDASGKVLWSWHIWVTDFDPDATAYTTTPNASGTTWTFMDRNIGAVSVDRAGNGSHGLIYQWGRKDPFPSPVARTLLDENYNYVDGKDGEATLYDIDGNTLPKIGSLAEYHGSLDASIANPMVFYAQTYTFTGEYDEYGEEIVLNDPLTGDWTDESNDDFWGGESMKKSIYDPCPPGWKVPVCDADGNTPYAWLVYANMTWDAVNNGAEQNGQWFPATGTRVYASGGCDFAENGNPYGGLWIGTKGKTAADLTAYPTLYGQYMFIINGKRTFKVNKDKRSQGMSLRAVKDI